MHVLSHDATQVGRVSLVSSLNKLTTRDWGTCVPDGSRTSTLTAVTVGSRRLGPLVGWKDRLVSRETHG